MEAIVTKLLGKYFKLFIKNFVKENFKMSILKGEGSLTNSGEYKYITLEEISTKNSNFETIV
jgi:hypothetical protein